MKIVLVRRAGCKESKRSIVAACINMWRKNLSLHPQPRGQCYNPTSEHAMDLRGANLVLASSGGEYGVVSNKHSSFVSCLHAPLLQQTVCKQLKKRTKNSEPKWHLSRIPGKDEMFVMDQLMKYPILTSDIKKTKKN